MSGGFGVRETLCWTGGTLRSEARRAAFDGVSIDTRTLRPGELFVAIRGPQHDAHRYLDQAVAGGAAGLLVDRDAEVDPALGTRVPVVAVEDTTTALGALGTGHRLRFHGPVVAITGSNGKTTTKEMCAAILDAGERAPCLKTEGNLNNEYGVPLTLLRRREEHRSLVVEMGMNHRHEIARLVRIARPTIGLVTNVGTAHIGQLGSREEIAREKGDLFAGLGPDGVAIVNRDDPRVVAQAARAPGRVVHFGHDPTADVRARAVRFLDRGAFRFELITPHGARDVEVPGLAETAVINGLAAAAAALEAGAGLDDVVAGLGAYRNVGGRMARRVLADGVVLIDDTYNANPQSMRAALESLSQLKSRGRAIAVLGDMGELGHDAEEAHRSAGRWAAELGVDWLFALGEWSAAVVEGALEAGMSNARALADADPERAGREIGALLRPRDWVLVKGSRSMRMENVVEALARLREERDRREAC